MTDPVVRLEVLLEVDGEADAEALAEATAQLREELLELDVARVDAPPGGEAPPGARAGELIALGSLIVTLAQSSGLLTSVISTVQSWVARQGSRSVRLEVDGDVLEVTGLSSRQQRELIQTWVNRHAPPGAEP